MVWITLDPRGREIQFTLCFQEILFDFFFYEPFVLGSVGNQCGNATVPTDNRSPSWRPNAPRLENGIS